MTLMTRLLTRLEKSVASTKFAVVILLIFTLFMVAGTLCESYYGTEFSGRVIYKSPLFMGVQAVMLFSIFYALLHRLPFKKRLYGFYTVHTGLILLFCGSFITYYSGVDGQITLFPNEPSRTVTLPRDMLTIVEEGKNKITYTLPRKAFPADLDVSRKEITLKRYLPFSEDQLEWQKHQDPPSSSSRYRLFNKNFSQELIMSHHPKASVDFPPATKLGPLSVYYIPPAIAPCFSKSQLILYNIKTKSCRTFEELSVPLKKTQSKKAFFVMGKGDSLYTFFPNQSPWPFALDKEKKLNPVKSSPLRLFSKKIVETQEGPTLLLFGKNLSYRERGSEEWVVKSFEQKPIPLPWMNFAVELLDHKEKSYPKWIPHYQPPLQVNNKVVRGNQRALQIEIQGQPYWISSERPLGVRVGEQKYTFYLGHQTIELPFEVNLTRFKMTTDPGTQNPASYESFVNVFSRKGVFSHHIFMNNPLKFNYFTLYQASYFPLQKGGYGSVLSVNFDPGRFLKYIACILIVLGSLWHFYLRRRKNISSPSFS